MRPTLCVLIALFVWLPSCTTNGGSSGGSRSDGRASTSNAARSNSNSGSSAAARESDPRTTDNERAVRNVVRDARIVLHQAKDSQNCILVNFQNKKRATRDGRMELVNGDAKAAYKPLSDKLIDDLLEFFAQNDGQVIRERWVDGDERYLKAKEGDIPGFRGVIYVENDGQKYKYMQWKPANEMDTVGQKKQMIFVNLKGAVLVQFNAVSRTESPDAAIVGEDDFDAFKRR